MRELIYKDEAYKAIDNCIRDSWDRISPADAKMNISHLISDANEVGKPQGEWINIKISISGDSSAECSLCGAVVHNNFSNVINFCPNCGADMRESN